MSINCRIRRIMKSQINRSLCHIVWFIACLYIITTVTLSYQSGKAAGSPNAGDNPEATAKPGTPELPLLYDGPGLVDPKAPDGRLIYSPGVQNFQVYRASRKPAPFFRTVEGDQPGYTYNHHMDIACWKGRLYVAWDMSRTGEDNPPCHLVYSTSTDGMTWSDPQHLYPFNKGWHSRFYFFRASNDRMLAFASGPYPTDNISESEKKTLLVREITADHRLAEIFTLIKPGPTYPPSFEQSKDTGFVAACREAINNRPLLEQADYGLLLGDRRMKWHEGKNWPGGQVPLIGGKLWVFGKAQCFFHRKDGTLISLSKMGFVTMSKDEGESWSMPVIPQGIVAGGGKIWGQRTPDGRYAMIYAPHQSDRWPMAVTTSDDGITFRDMRVIHGEVPPQRYAGRAKDTGPQYIRGVAEWAGDAQTIDKSAIWVVYSVGKEDIWLSRIPVPLKANLQEPVNDTFDKTSPGPRVPGWNIYAPIWAPVRIAKDPASPNQYLELEDREPVDYARAIRTFPVSAEADVSFRLAAAQADRGRLEIDLLGERGTRPVRLILNDKGQLQSANGQETVDLGTYQAGKWFGVTIKVKVGRFTLLRDGKEILRDATFTEASPTVYALSFRTGEFRGTVPERAKNDLRDTEAPVPAAVCGIDDVKTCTR